MLYLRGGKKRKKDGLQKFWEKKNRRPSGRARTL